MFGGPLGGGLRRRVNVFFVGALLGAVVIGSAVAAQSLRVVVRPAAELLVFPEASAPATVLAANDSRIGPQVSGQVLAVPVEVGQLVERGELLVRLDPADYELQRAQAAAALRALEARVELVRFQLERAEGMADTGAVSEEELRRRRAELAGLQAEREVQQAQLERARLELRRTQVRAPFRGVVMERLAQVGELATPGAPLVRLLDVERLEVSARVRGDDAAALAEAAELAFVADGRRYPLSLRAVTPALEQRDRSQEVRLSFAAEATLAGSAGRLVWRSASPHLPAELLVRRQDGLGVFLINAEDPGRVRFLPLPGAQEGRAAAVSLPGDSQVVTEGRFRLQDGDAVSFD